MKTIRYSWALALTLALTACDYLDKQPSASSYAPVTDSSQLLALYDYLSNNYSANYHAFYCHDDAELPKDMYASYPSTFDLNNVVSNYCLYRDGLIDATNDYFWTGEYSKIYRANLIIESAGSVEGDEDEINEALACAYFMRAYSFFDLATYYCLPWCDANSDALGIPLRTGTDYEEDISRGTLEKTYEQIFADLQKAEKYVTRQATDSEYPWRVSQCAIDALYSRIYLARADYDTALTYTEAALENAPELFDYNDFEWGTSTAYAASGDYPAETLDYCETNEWSASKFLYFQEWIFPRLAQNYAQWAMPSTELTALYDQDNDLRFTFFFVEHGNRRMSVLYDWYRYDQFFDGRYVISGLTTQELLLNKAELLVRTGSWSSALSVLDPLREARYVSGTATSLTASSESEALQQVLEERRRELPFAFRLGDIKRFSVNETSEDDVTIVRDFWEVSTSGVDTSTSKTWTIAGDSPLLAIPIYQTEINSSQGAIEQNPEE